VTSRWVVVLTFGTALGCGLNAGVFFAFSSFVMKALARLSPAQGIAAMNSMNITAVTPLFMTALFGPGATCLLLAIVAVSAWHKPGAGYLFVGAAVYLTGAILVTIVFNVPRNDALARVNPSDAEASRFWLEYVRSWTMWNHVRTVAALVSAALLTFALCGTQHGTIANLEPVTRTVR